MTRSVIVPASPRRQALDAAFAGLFGALLGLSLIKFGNPVVMEKYVAWPANIYQWIFSPWPLSIAHVLLAIVTFAGLAAARWSTRRTPSWLFLLPAAWLLWEFISGTQTVSAYLTGFTLVHFGCCAICFYLGFFALAPSRHTGAFWAGLLGGFLVVLAGGFQQHFGGLEETRRMFFLYELPNMNPPPPPEFLKKMATNRIFSTLLYPNTLAGVILMILPPLVAALSSFGRHFTVGARRLLVAMVSLPALACLYWSGSKGGWLLMLIVVIVGALFLPIARKWKIAFGCAVLVLGLAGFAIRHANYLRRGAPSAEARVEYWRVALKIVHESPLLGTGPGTFAIPHARLKRPETEMARLTHNDYLEQACDSGIPGFLLYTALCLAVLCYTGSPPDLKRDPVRLAVWLGVLAWALQSLMEFGLYIPAISWPAFAFMGWLLGTRGGDAISNDGNGALTQA